MFNARGWVSVVELIVFIPALIAAIFVCLRHGFKRSYGWIFTLILCVVRIIGAVCQLLTYNDHSSGLIQTTLIVDSIGLSPLLLATLGLLSRFTDTINVNSTSPFTTKHFRLTQLLISIGLILSIVGGTRGTVKPDGTIEIATESKAGIGLYIVAYIALAFICLLSIRKVSSVPPTERRVPLAVIAALPFILVRLVYSALSVFIHNHLFNIVNGSVVVLIIMAVAEEFIVVAIYLLLGFCVDSLTQYGPVASRPWKMNKRGRQTHLSRTKHQNQSNDTPQVYELRQGGPNAV
ncbi:hypothetical protein BCR34DRAFT_471557 [Clohesyomyces aquaticus]|uniref:DUF7702 domain-containing protein n=1 Tax=Clohesyomyces aquaticus TaxID=1231657 RepID=A0A1Y2AB21_9PLEO|nr:hypothetical protein BCR34DRAFT_471557 [Clohesyomyces aquaticus]